MCKYQTIMTTLNENNSDNEFEYCVCGNGGCDIPTDRLDKVFDCFACDKKHHYDYRDRYDCYACDKSYCYYNMFEWGRYMKPVLDNRGNSEYQMFGICVDCYSGRLKLEIRMIIPRVCPCLDVICNDNIYCMTEYNDECPTKYCEGRYHDEYDTKCKVCRYRVEFMKEGGIGNCLIEAVWHPRNMWKFKYLDHDTYSDIL